MRHLVGQREQKIVVIVMMRAKQLRGLLHELPVRLDLIVREFEILRLIGKQVEMHGRTRCFEIDALEVLAREHRRIDERFEADRLE